MSGVGISRVLKRGGDVDRFKILSAKLTKESEQNVESMVSDFCYSFQKFIGKYSSQINSNPQLYDAITTICQNLDIDLSSYNGNEIHKNMSNRIGEKIVQICAKLRTQNGGLLDVEHCVWLMKPRYPNITVKDIIRSVQQLSILGAIDLLTIGHRTVISTNCQINDDENQCLSLINSAVYTSLKKFSGIKVSDLVSKLNWNNYRAESCLKLLVAKGILWVDHNTFGKSFDKSNDLQSNSDLFFSRAEYLDNMTFYALF
ncbi:ESCRT-II complex subunit VPS22 [Babesia microti strain RI]|uniref:ESCRT-II complex subunit VPS22 n=1 Tax=Babesia microti (strain RI) TaxID=1133968 RepID=I7J912_BABMR|nr:ESCRT-II complex subunit VPS22 [Babesia microti strain RI]CCF73119.1 ESCRT-II complex subunit VPS22 [Babesia microti strain RI]|eukprot:XP_012647728.1 ESCRT-II complex subunit VPS22 [Babesia microti strain RI]